MHTEIRNSRTILKVPGVLVDVIDGIGERSTVGNAGSKGLFQAKYDSNIYGSIEALNDALWRTLTENIQPNVRPAPSTYCCILPGLKTMMRESAEAETLSPQAQSMHSFLRNNSSLQIANQTLKTLVEAHQSSIDHFGFKDALEQSWRFQRGRRLGTTDTGYLGMVPNATLPGDIIAVLFGNSVPVVLRSRQYDESAVEFFELTGPCYYHGVMGGEAIKWTKDGSKEEKLFHIT